MRSEVGQCGTLHNTYLDYVVQLTATTCQPQRSSGERSRSFSVTLLFAEIGAWVNLRKHQE